jgi:hypothetical protein
VNDPFGEFYREVWVGLGTELYLAGLVNLRVWTRPDTKTIFFFSDAGIVTVQKLECLEFDGWELFVGSDHSVRRFEDVRTLQMAVIASLNAMEDQNNL